MLGGTRGAHQQAVARLLPHDIILDDVRSLHLLGGHAGLLHQRLGQHGVSARQGRMLVVVVITAIAIVTTAIVITTTVNAARTAAPRQVHVQLTLVVWSAHNWCRLDIRVCLCSLKLSVPQGAEFFVRLVCLIHEGVCVVQWRRLEHSFQHWHIFNNLSFCCYRP